MRNFSSNKGQANNYISAIVFLVMFVLMTLIGVVFTVNIINSFESSTYNVGKMQEAINWFKGSYYFWDYIVILLVVVFAIGVAVTSYRLRTTPIGYIITFIFAAVWGFISYFFNYMFIQIIGVDAFSGILIYFPMTQIALTNCHWIALAYIILGAIMLYAKAREPEGEILR